MRWTEDDYPQTRRCERSDGSVLVVSRVEGRRLCNQCVVELQAAAEEEAPK
jgi:hypothetical protein